MLCKKIATDLFISAPIKLSRNEIQGRAITSRQKLNMATDKSAGRMATVRAVSGFIIT